MNNYNTYINTVENEEFPHRQAIEVRMETCSGMNVNRNNQNLALEEKAASQHAGPSLALGPPGSQMAPGEEAETSGTALSGRKWYIEFNKSGIWELENTSWYKPESNPTNICNVFLWWQAECGQVLCVALSKTRRLFFLNVNQGVWGVQENKPTVPDTTPKKVCFRISNTNMQKSDTSSPPSWRRGRAGVWSAGKQSQRPAGWPAGWVWSELIWALLTSWSYLCPSPANQRKEEKQIKPQRVLDKWYAAV